jgi:pSer/pThr/pTyr-binding forkhead associated (FHA) protein
MATPTLIFIHGPLAGRRVQIGSDERTFGRASQNDIVLTDPLVSRLHGLFMHRGGVYLIEDLGSHNGTYVNDERLHGIRQLRHGDRITIGSSKILFEDPSMAGDEPTQIRGAADFGAVTFTQRQVQVLRLMARGLSNRQIGERLGVTERTAKAYVASIFEKLQVNKRASAVAEALRLGLIDTASQEES